MLDQWGREIDYLRISLIDRCNLRCKYCMPEKNLKFIPIEELLTIDEVFRVTKLISQLGIKKVRITGGEPLLREGIVGLIKDIKALENIKEVCLTTNGILLQDYLDGLISAGLDRVNVSLDSLKEESFKDITGGGSIISVLTSIEKAIEKGLKVRVNTVIIKDYNEDEILDFVRLTEEKNLDVRFIEMMPIGAGKAFKAITTDEIKNLITKEVTLNQCKKENKKEGPATYYKTEKAIGKIGFISPISHSFCGHCNRIRLTAEGFLKQCLHWDKGVNLKKIMRQGITDSELISIIKECIYSKPAEHNFFKTNQTSDKRYMYQIGG